MQLSWIHLLCFATYIATSCVSGRRYYYAKCKADAEEPFSYRGRNGPQFWPELFPEMCKGKEQSPVDIDRYNVIHDETLEKLIMKNYDIPVKKGVIFNNGHTVQVNITDNIERTILIMEDIYQLVNFHFHWGETYYKGSEHTIDKIQYSMEMHLVHRNKYNEIAVVAVFFQEQEKVNEELQNFIKHFPIVKFKDDSCELKFPIKLEHLLPYNPSSFYRYVGSLTVPTCAEGVIWSILPNPLPVGHHQMEEFRKLFSARKEDASWKCRLTNNFRPLQPLNGRKIFASQ